jgi:hypothetical protein
MQANLSLSRRGNHRIPTGAKLSGASGLKVDASVVTPRPRHPHDLIMYPSDHWCRRTPEEYRDARLALAAWFYSQGLGYEDAAIVMTEMICDFISVHANDGDDWDLGAAAFIKSFLKTAGQMKLNTMAQRGESLGERRWTETMMDLTKMSEAELDALDINGPVVGDWLHMIADQSENPDWEWSDDESRVWTHLLHRTNQEMRRKRQEARSNAASWRRPPSVAVRLAGVQSQKEVDERQQYSCNRGAVHRYRRMMTWP